MALSADERNKKKKQHRGIFTQDNKKRKWDWTARLRYAEDVLEENFRWSPVYPFEEIEPNIFLLTVVSSRLYVAGTIAVLILLISVITFSIIGVNEYIVYPIIALVLFSSQVLSAWDERRYVLDSNAFMYEYYRGKKLVYRGHYHNIYIRLKGQNSGGGDTFYSLVLGGYLVDEESISATTPRLQKLAKLGRRLAGRLQLNYFDSPDTSRCHIIRHRCPHRLDIDLQYIYDPGTRRKRKIPLSDVTDSDDPFYF